MIFSSRLLESSDWRSIRSRWRTFYRPDRQRVTCHLTGRTYSLLWEQLRKYNHGTGLSLQSVAKICMIFQILHPQCVPRSICGLRADKSGLVDRVRTFANSSKFFSNPQIEPPWSTVPWVIAGIFIAEPYQRPSTFTRVNWLVRLVLLVSRVSSECDSNVAISRGGGDRQWTRSWPLVAATVHVVVREVRLSFLSWAWQQRLDFFSFNILIIFWKLTFHSSPPKQ